MFPFQHANHESLSLLLVEDDQIAREAASRALQRTFPFLKLREAGDGVEGLELYRSHRPDIVITDINMPEMNGILMAQQIRALEPAAHIIVVSGHNEIQYLQDCIRIGIRHFVLKPLELTPLFEAISDCMARVEMDRQLQRQEQYIKLLSQVVEQNSSMIAIADQSGEVQYVNSRYCEVTGYSADELVHRDLRELHFPGTSWKDFDEIWHTINAGLEWRGEGVNRRQNGDLYHEAASLAPIFDEAGGISHFVTIRNDISTRKKMQEEMDRAQRLESLGVMAGGIAHGFNNVLTGILGNISYAQTLTADDRLKRPLDEAEKAAQRAAELTRQLLTFARGGKPVKQRASLQELVDQALRLSLNRSDLHWEVAIPDSIHAVEVDQGQIRQAFSNILINAGEAMPEGGKVLVQAENLVLAAENELGLAPGNYVRIVFTDQGAGVPPGIRERIFDPYFSTRSGSSGLGLASTHSIISSHNGHVGIAATAGPGATFVCHLPCTDAVYLPPPCPAPRLSRPASGARVLFMDDDQAVVKVAVRMLQSLGYQVTSCSEGAEAIERYRQAQEEGAPYLAVIMDLTVVGGMGGEEAAARLLELDPEARLVVSSGYYDHPVLADYREHGFCHVLPKPYKLANLSELMETLSNGAADSSAPQRAA